MNENNKLYCTGCKKITNHIPKLSALMDGCMVCNNCSKMNGFCSLIKVGDDNFQKHSKEVRWVEFNEEGKGKELRDKVIVGSSLIMSPFNESFTWMTTIVIEIVEERDNYVHFKTENTEYKLYYNIQNV
jgi:hypothetical protein